MPTINGILGHAYNVVSDGKYILSPKPKNINNTFDYIGQLVGLPRLPGERNADYRKRIIDVYVNRGGSNYDGLINAITRELGLKKQNVIVVAAAGSNNPRLVVNDTKLYLYSEWKHEESFTLDLKIDIYDKAGPAYYLSDLVNYVNLNSAIFTFTLAAGMGNIPSWCLIQRDSLLWSNVEPIRLYKRNVLLHKNIVTATEKFTSASDKIFQVVL